MSDSERQRLLHNKLAGEIVRSIVAPVKAAGGTEEDILVLTESVLVGVCAVIVKLGGDNAVLDVIVDGARQRLAEMRLTNAAPKGTA